MNLPVSTIVDKIVPKNAFWGRDSSIRNILTHEFDSIIWLYKLTPATLNVEKGNNVDEIDIFYCKMKSAILLSLFFPPPLSFLPLRKNRVLSAFHFHP